MRFHLDLQLYKKYVLLQVRQNVSTTAMFYSVAAVNASILGALMALSTITTTKQTPDAAYLFGLTTTAFPLASFAVFKIMVMPSSPVFTELNHHPQTGFGQIY